MGNFFSRFSGEPLAQGCGLTIDSHTTDQKFDVVQYLWAAPLVTLGDARIDDITDGVTSAAKRAGFSPTDVSPYITNLPNESAVLDTCPFQPEMCLGEHLVISGAGKVL
jgi:hypothetical protein